MKRADVIFAIGISMVLAACGGDAVDPGQAKQGVCGDENRAATFVEGIEMTGEEGRFTAKLLKVTINEQVTKPDRGDNVWQFELLDPGGAAMVPSNVRLKGWMPDHGHGINPLWIDAASLAEPGLYEVGPFDLFMSGFWQFTIEIDANDIIGQAVAGFCLGG